MFNKREQRVLLFLVFFMIIGIVVFFLKDSWQKETIEIIKSKGLVEIFVCGKVTNPGVYRFFRDRTIKDILELAGVINGITGKISLSILNADEVTNMPVNLNTATRNELESLPFIGPKLALNMMEYRNKHGNFKFKEEIMNIRGIGIKKFSSISDLIFVDNNKNGKVPVDLEVESGGTKEERMHKIKNTITISQLIGMAGGFSRDVRFLKLEVR